jgi:hypothetical protein
MRYTEENPTRMSSKEEAICYPNGSCYLGEVSPDGLKHGKGQLSTRAIVVNTRGVTVAMSEANAWSAKWIEYEGQWVNDKMHGPGIMREMRGDGSSVIIYDGAWDNGERVIV